MFPPALLERAAALLDAYRTKGWRIATAESCTGGLVAGLLTEIAGSSDVVERGFVTYSNEAKSGLLGVSSLTHRRARSGERAGGARDGARARSADPRRRSRSSITGVAGPGGATATKPVGLVHFGLATAGGATEHLERRYGDLGRGAVRWRRWRTLALLERRR